MEEETISVSLTRRELEHVMECCSWYDPPLSVNADEFFSVNFAAMKALRKAIGEPEQFD